MRSSRCDEKKDGHRKKIKKRTRRAWEEYKGVVKL